VTELSLVAGPLTGVTVVELAGIGPAPFAAMLLADMGATVIRIDRPATARPAGGVSGPASPIVRNRRSIVVDLRTDAAIDIVLRLVARADALVEGFRPGVAERLGFGPARCHEINRRLVYGRVTGWGQDGPWAHRPGHDINYVAVSGTLDAIGRAGQPPTPPLNLLGDYAGGGMLLAIGVLAALVEVSRGADGRVVDAAMVDGAALLATMIHGLRNEHRWRAERGTNILDTGAPFYDVYETADGKHIAVGAIEAAFYAEFLAGIGLSDDELGDQMDEAAWPAQKARIAAVIKTRSRDEWSAVFDGRAACVTPVLTMAEAPRHPHLMARGSFRTVGPTTEPAPAPRFLPEVTGKTRRATQPGRDTDTILAELGLAAADVAELRRCGAVQ
jgi:alpha-methylacyl-CoA racemase